MFEMKKVLRAVLCATLILTVVVTPMLAMAATTSFRASGEHFSNAINKDSRAVKSGDGDRSFYVTITQVYVMDAHDKVYFGPRQEISTNVYSGSLSNGLGYDLSKNPRQKARYTKFAEGRKPYVLNVKQSTNGPGNLFVLDVMWTP